MNVFQELFRTKLIEKLSIEESSTGSGIISNSFSESFFEKLALLEFESSIYNQLSCAKILLIFYEQVVYSEMKLLKTKQSGASLMVHSLDKSSENSNVLLSQVKNLKLMRKKLSLTVSDFG